MFSTTQVNASLAVTPVDAPETKTGDDLDIVVKSGGADRGEAEPARAPRPAPSPLAEGAPLSEKPAMKPAAAAQAARQRGAGLGVRPTPPETLLGRSMVIKGDIDSKGGVQIDGAVEGRIRAHTLIVADTAMVRGEIVADVVTVHGSVVGPIRAAKLMLSASARVKGDLVHAEIAVEPGAQFEGSVKFSEAPLEAATDRRSADA